MTTEQLLRNIEECRERMIDLASYTSMADHEVVKASTELDRLINQYFHLTKKQ
ncbi:aspartyl-phosphate phosphatase Spo0E family protein [Peribacillus glennii]|uniref:Aspartyl-phosphate phosphatase Spo0E family protein n=2 Tax=Peribacillus glennii TaxID=2303991 RepID=A0A372L773_9BACI|nr:aspartyl-phosphate phosphatase Spo0E family protein [Peribacillus glennii]